jgi:hypothetical protein
MLGAADPVTIPADGHDASRGTGVLELARAIRAGAPERASGEMGYHVLDAMLAVEESVAAGQTVLVESRTAVPPPLPADWDPHVRTL